MATTAVAVREDLGYTRYDEMAGALSCYAEYVEAPEEIRPVPQRTWREVEEGTVGFVNVNTDYRAHATTLRFSSRRGAPARAPSCLMPTGRQLV